MSHASPTRQARFRLRYCPLKRDDEIMAVPKRKHSNHRTGTRRSHDAKKPCQTQYCPQCSNAVPSHTVCPNCGYYMGRVVVEVKD